MPGSWLIAVLMAAAIGVFVAVAHRNPSGWPIPGLQDWLIQLNTRRARELTICMSVWMAQSGAAYGVRTCIHVGVGVLIMTPIPLPVAMTLGIDPLHFGIMMVVSMAVGMCHRPVGLNLYVASGIAKMGISELAVAVMSWLLTMLSFLVVTCAPQISPRLPNRLYGSCVALARWIDQ